MHPGRSQTLEFVSIVIAAVVTAVVSNFAFNTPATFCSIPKVASDKRVVAIIAIRTTTMRRGRVAIL